MKNKVLALSTALLTAAMATTALAVPLAPSGVALTSGSTFTPQNSGGVLNDNILNFEYDPTPATTFNNVGGQVQNRVVENADGNMVFMPRIRETYNIDGGTFVVTAFRLFGFEGFDVDVDYRTDGLGDKGFTSVSRSADGDLMTFRFDDPLYVDSLIPPGRQQESYFTSIVTDATDYDFSGSMSLLGYIDPLNGATTHDVTAPLFSVMIGNIAAPITTPVPLPAPFAMLGAALMGMGVFARRKKA